MERAPIQRVLFTSHPVRPYVDTILVNLYLITLYLMVLTATPELMDPAEELRNRSLT